MKHLINLKSLLVLLLFIILQTPSFAGATLQIKGKVHAFDTKKIQIKTRRHIYHIKKMALPLHIVRNLEKTAKQEVTLLVPMHGIIKVKNLKKGKF